MSEQPWIAHYDKGVSASLEYPPEPLFYFLQESARKYPDRACTIFKGAAISFKEMDGLTDHLAAALADLGVKKGDRVGIFMPNTPQFVMAYFGILKAGVSWWRPTRCTRRPRSLTSATTPASRSCSS